MIPVHQLKPATEFGTPPENLSGYTQLQLNAIARQLNERLANILA